MEQLKLLQGELDSMSVYNPVYAIKVVALISHVETLTNIGKLSITQASSIRDKFQTVDVISLGAYRVYKNALNSNFTLKDFDLASLLELREKLYDIFTKVKECTVFFDEGFVTLIQQLETRMQNEEESFWDSFFLLLILLRTPCNFTIFEENKVNILRFIKYAAEQEGKLIDSLSEGRMELFANITPSVGKSNAILFHLTRTKFVDTNSLFSVVQGITNSDSSFVRQVPKLTLLLENYAKAKNQLDTCSILELVMQEQILQENLWIFESYFKVLKQTIFDYNYYLMDYRLYAFLLKHVIERAMINGKCVETNSDVDDLCTLLDKYNVEYFGRDELYKIVNK